LPFLIPHVHNSYRHCLFFFAFSYSPSPQMPF
jgi:hypothetical protein